jgi:HEPN domain-containing protein
MNMHSAQAQSMMAAGLRDRLTLRLLRDSGEAPVEVMGFHAQQACEKFIKAVLVLHGVIFERTHDLALLASLCAAHRILVPAD